MEYLPAGGGDCGGYFPGVVVEALFRGELQAHFGGQEDPNLMCAVFRSSVSSKKLPLLSLPTENGRPKQNDEMRCRRCQGVDLLSKDQKINCLAIYWRPGIMFLYGVMQHLLAHNIYTSVLPRDVVLYEAACILHQPRHCQLSFPVLISPPHLYLFSLNGDMHDGSSLPRGPCM